MKKNRLVYYLASLLFLTGVIYSCRKESLDNLNSIESNDIELVKKAKIWQADNKTYVKENGESDLNISKLVFDWDKYVVDTNKSGQPVLTVPIHSLVSTEHIKYLELGFVLDQEGNGNGMIKEYLGNPFVGEMTLNLYTGVGKKFESGWYRADTKELAVKNIFRYQNSLTSKKMAGGGGMGGTLEEVNVYGYQPPPPPPIIYIPPTIPTYPPPTIPIYPGGAGGGGSIQYFSENEFNSVLERLQNSLNGDPIEFYLIASYKNSKLLNSSTYSIGTKSIKVGDYTLTPHYDSKGVLKFYTASRNTLLGIEYIIRADALIKFQINYTLYSAAANAFYINGIPSHSQIQMASGDFFAGLSGSWASAIKDPAYYMYLTHVLYGIGVNTFELKPLGLGTTGRATANDLNELLAMKEIMSNPRLGKTVMFGMGDSRWLGWDKMQYTHQTLDGTKITIHYVARHQNGVIIAVDDFKFVN